MAIPGFTSELVKYRMRLAILLVPTALFFLFAVLPYMIPRVAQCPSYVDAGIVQAISNIPINHGPFGLLGESFLVVIFGLGGLFSALMGCLACKEDKRLRILACALLPVNILLGAEVGHNASDGVLQVGGSYSLTFVDEQKKPQTNLTVAATFMGRREFKSTDEHGVVRLAFYDQLTGSSLSLSGKRSDTTVELPREFSVVLPSGKSTDHFVSYLIYAGHAVKGGIIVPGINENIEPFEGTIVVRQEAVGTSSGTANPADAVSLFEAAGSEYKQGQLLSALNHLSHAIEADPRFGPAYLLRAGIERKSGSLRSSWRDYHEAILLNSPGLEAIEDLNLSRPNFANEPQVVEDAGLVHIENAAGIEKLSLFGNSNVTDVGLRSVGKLRRLRGLDLGFTGISDGGLASIVDLHNLEDLDLNSTNITNEGLRDVGRLSNLRVLRLISTHTTNSGLDHLKNLKNLRDFYFGYTGITADRVQLALPQFAGHCGPWVCTLPENQSPTTVRS